MLKEDLFTRANIVRHIFNMGSQNSTKVVKKIRTKDSFIKDDEKEIFFDFKLI